MIIEPTEALTVIDVNSGSFTRSATSRETVLWTNCEAATEIARQLRLRNIAGIIVIDFIDMDARRDQLQVLEHFSKALKADKSRPQIAQLTELGLVEITRKRQGQSIYEIFGKPCPTCEGLGILTHLPGMRHDQVSGGDPYPTFAPPSEEFDGFEGEEFSAPPTSEYEEEEGGDLDLTSHPVFRNERRRPILDRRPAAPSGAGNGAPSPGGGGRNRRRRGRSGNGRGDDFRGAGEANESASPVSTGAIETTPSSSSSYPPVLEAEESSQSEPAIESPAGRESHEELPPEMPIDHVPPAEQEVLAYMGLPAELLRGPALTSGNTSILSVRPPSAEKDDDEGEANDPRRRRRRRPTRGKAETASGPVTTATPEE